MNDLTDMTYKIVFLGLLAGLISLSMPSFAQDTGNVGGPGSTNTFEGRGAVSPLPAPDIPATPDALDTTPSDEVTSGTTGPTAEDTPKGADHTGAASNSTPAAVDSPAPVNTAENLGVDDSANPKPWWHFW